MKSTPFKAALGKRYVMIVLPLLCLGLLVNVFWPDRETSALENRPLAKFPAWTPSFLDDQDLYISDQYVGRDLAINANYLLKKLEGVREIDNVYLGKGTLIQESMPYDASIVDRNMDALSAFRQTYPLNTMLMVVPTAASVEKDKLPPFVDTPAEALDDIFAKSGEGITNIDVRPIFNDHKQERLYYKTDHHWTSLGASLAFEALAQSQGWTPAKATVYPLTKDFQGTLASKTGSPFLKDDIDLYVPENIPEYVVTYGGDHKSRTMYDADAMDAKNKYEVFLGPNQGMVKIECDNDSDRRLVLFKDSYANSLLQFLIPQYRTITIIDPRYYYDDIDRVMKSDLITDVLVVYNYSNFVSDATLADVLSSANG